MKHWFGGLLSLALGVVLIVGGGLGTNSATGGVQAPSCQPVLAAGVAVPCPTGTITINEKTEQAAAFAHVPALAPTPPASWTVTITSTNCTSPNGTTVNMMLTVPNGGSATSGDLFIYSTPSHTASCSYTLAETPVAGFTATFDPPSPVTIPFGQSRTGSTATVVLTNTFAAPITTTTPAPVTSSASEPPSTGASSTSEPPATGTDGVGAASSSAAPLAGTGPHEPIRGSLVAGIALCLLGLVLLVAGRRGSRAARHRN